MATTRKITSRLITGKSSPCPFRWLSTTAQTETGTLVKQTKKSFLLYKVKANVSKSSITEILNEYQNEGNIVKRFDILSLSSYLRHQKNYESALQLYDWVESSKLKITNADQATRIQLLCKTEDLSSAEKYFNSLQESEKNYKTYGALLSCYCRKKVLDKAWEIFEKMKALNHYVSDLSYKDMLCLYYSAEQHEKVVSLVQEMEEKHTVRDRYAYNMLMNSYAALKNLDALEDVLEKMKSNNNIKVDLFTYGNLANMFFKSGQHIKAKTYLEMMEKTENQPKKELARAACTRIRLYSEMSDLSAVNRAWESLKSIFPTPNNDCYHFMLLGLSKLGELERLEKLYNDWEKRSADDFDFRLPNVLLEHYLNHNLIEKATVLYENLVCRADVPNIRTLKLFATLCMRKCQIDLGMKYLEMGVNKGGDFNNWVPMDETMKLFLKYFEEANDADRFEKFVLIMKKVKRLDFTIYDSWLSNMAS